MPTTPADAILCPACGKRASGPYPDGLCRRCYDIKRKGQPPLTPAKFADLQEKLKIAEATGDWKELADSLQDTVKAIASGVTKATAAQTSIIKHILDRAYGKVSKSQEDKRGPVGIIILPTLGFGESAHICKQCIEAHKLHEQ